LVIIACVYENHGSKDSDYNSTHSLNSSLDDLDGQHHASAALTPGRSRKPL